MQILRSPAAMQRLAQRWRKRGVKVGLVPTMGYLHEGHLSLIRGARRRVGKSGQVVVSIYVNPTQFAPTEDLSRYPRDLKRDLKLCRGVGADVVFVPSDGTMYPGKAEGKYSTYVVEESLSRSMEGHSRPTHFRGVTTVVAKLFNLVLPEVAVFGAKDWQQAAVIKRMVADLNFPLRIVVAPIVREADGVAMSSRNKYLRGDLRSQATVLSRSIKMAKDAVRAKPKPAARLKAAVARMVRTAADARLDYVEFFDSDTLKPVKQVQRGTHMALAMFLGKTRLIDNGRL
ncbi:MAG TPA: pantoate--beta-alanine ligase [Verrucomicrobiae bacterium]|nr:pantoate--beta-alanine ligase [Verrucomicrobiae bacterium]